MTAPTTKSPKTTSPTISNNSITRHLLTERIDPMCGVEPCYPKRSGSFEGGRGRCGGKSTSHWVFVAAVLASLGAAVPPAAAQDTRVVTPDPLRYVAPSRTYQTVHTALDLDVDLERRRIAGHVLHTIRSLRDDLAEVRMNCVGLVIDSVVVNSRRAQFEYPVPADQSTSWLAGASEGVADDQLVVACDPVLARGADAQVAVYYSGAPEIGLYWIPTEKGIPEKRLEVWSQGEGEDNRHWVPCNDYPNEKATFEGRFRVAKGYSALSNGALMGTREVGGKTEFHWKLDQPQVTYLIMLAVAKYKIYEQKWRDIPVTYWVPPTADDATILRGYGLTPDMIEYFEKEIGIDYPYAKYAQVVVQDFIYGGMENTSSTVMNMRTLYDERAALTRSEQGLVAHELAHQWWGDMLTCREWSHMWLNEGFATYYAYLYRAHHDGDDAFRYQMHDVHQDVTKADDAEPRPMVVDFFNRSDARNNALVYVKGASTLHMLRAILGDDLYRETIRHYGEAHKFDVVDTQDLMRAVRDVTGENLDWFFEQWAFLAGHPKFKVSKSWDKEAGVLSLKVEQTQKTSGLVPVFRVPVDVEIVWEGGRETKRIMVEETSSSYYFRLPSEPKMVVFDKGDWILKTLDFPKQTHELIYELDHGDFMTRVRAAEALAAKGSDQRTVPALRSTLLGDAYWGLRREAALALGKIGNGTARAALLEGIAAGEARVRLASAEALGGFYRDEKAATGLEKVVGADPAYGVRAAAIASLVKIRAERASRVCLDALKQESDQDIVRNAALHGLADLNEPSSLDRIKPYCTSGNRRVYRNTAITSYAKIAKNLDRESDRRRAAEFLYPSLEDWHLRTRGAAIDALATIAAPSSVEPLRRVANTDHVAEVREKARKAADRITADVAKASALTNAADIEDLKRRLASLERELETAKKQLAPTPSEHAEGD